MYYVYTLTDPRCGGVFYVGKGKGNRISAHVKEARKGVQSHKCNRIRAILDAGHEVVEEIVRKFKSEEAAYRYEERLNAKIGLENLTNIEPGGRGDCRGAREGVESRKVEKMLGQVLARVLKHLSIGNRLHILGVDVTDQMNRFTDAMIKRYGDEHIIKLVRPYGVELTISRA